MLLLVETNLKTFDASFYGLAAKYEKLKARRDRDPNPFVDPKGYMTYVDDSKRPSKPPSRASSPNLKTEAIASIHPDVPG